MRKNWIKQELIDFENRIGDLYLDNKLPFLFHLSGGNEDQLIDIFKDIKDGDYVISNHRSHYHALLHGIPPETVEQHILEGRSMFIYDRDRNFFCSAIIGATPAIAAGIAWALKRKGSKQRVWCFIGDMTSETGIAQTALRYAENHNLPMTFVIEDNGLSVLTDTRVVWNSNTLRFEEHSSTKAIYYKYASKYPHAGAGARVQF